jgi:hypothetical protein
MGHGFNEPCRSEKCCCFTISLPERTVGSVTAATTARVVTADDPNPGFLCSASHSFSCPVSRPLSKAAAIACQIKASNTDGPGEHHAAVLCSTAPVDGTWNAHAISSHLSVLTVRAGPLLLEDRERSEG